MSTSTAIWEEDERVIARAIYHEPDESDTAQAVSRLAGVTLNSPVLRKLLQLWKAASIEGQLVSEVLAEKFRIDDGNLLSLLDFTEGGPVLRGTYSGLISAVDRTIARSKAPKFHVAVEDYFSGKITQSELLDVVGTDCGYEQDDTFSLSEAIQMVRESKEHPRIKTGFRRLDKATRGLPANRVSILASRPGVGKSDFALWVALEVLKSGKKVFLASLEMDSHELVKRLERNGGAELSKFGSNLIMDCSGKQTVARISGQVRHFKPDLVIVDYLQILDCDASARDLYTRTTLLSNQIRTTAKGSSYTTPAAWLVLSQLSRSVRSENTRPVLSDLRDSGAIEQDADTVLFLHEPEARDDYSNVRDVQLSIAKNRSGECGYTNFLFTPSLSKWEEVS